MYTIGWIPCGNEQFGSSRITAFNVHKEFLKMGIASYILRTPSTIQHELKMSTEYIQKMLKQYPLDVLFLQKVFDRRVVELAQAQHIKVVLGMCDVARGIDPLLHKVDTIMVYSDYHKERLLKDVQHKTHVMFNGYETPMSLCRIHKDQAPLKVVSFGAQLSSFPLWLIKNISHVGHRTIGIGFDSKIRRRLLKQKGEHHKWDLQSVYLILSNCDIGLIHADMSNNFCIYKSSNRLVQMMALGLPVIASPVPSYLKIIEQGKNGFIATSYQDWIYYLEILKDVKVRTEMGMCARESVLNRFSIQQQANCYHSLFRQLLGCQ